MPQDEPLADREGLDQAMNRSHRRSELSSPTTGDKAKGIDAASLLQNTSSIQSMLRNTTETGGVGHFSQAQRQASSPRAGRAPRLSPSPRVGSKNFSSSLPRRQQESPLVSGRSMPKGSRHALPFPPPGPDFHSPSPLSYQEPTRSLSVEEYRTSTTTQSSYTAHNLNSHQPFAHHARHQNRGQMQRARPRSPFAYPTRLKRPGYRPSSPALSLSRSTHSGDPDRGSGSRTVSPASMYNLQRLAAPWQQVVNRSDPTLRYYPPIQGHPSSRGSTPRLAPSVGSMASSIRLSQVAVHYPGAWPVSPAVTPPPLFYDYSEAFEEQTVAAEQTHVHRISVSIITSPVDGVDDDQTQYWEHPPNRGSEILVELPSGNLPAPIVELNVFSPQNSRPNSGSIHQHVEFDVKPMSQNKPAEILVSSPPELNSATSRSSSSESRDRLVAKESTPSMLEEPASSSDIKEQATTASEGQELQGSGLMEPLEPTSNLDDPEQNESSQIASTGSVQSSVHGGMLEDSTEPTSRADTAEASPDGPPRTPINHQHSVEYLNGPSQSLRSQPSRTSLSLESIGTEFPEIVAPTPERSIISQSNRERFSKILGLNQDPHELDGITTPSRRHGDSSSFAADSEPNNNDALERCLSPTPAPRHLISDETKMQDDSQLKHGLMEAHGRPNNGSYDNLTRKSSSVSPRLFHKSSQWENSTPTNVRLSHRRMVINAGQTIETKKEPLYLPTTIVEDEAQETSLGSSSKESQPLSARHNATTPPLLIKAFAPPRGASQADLPFAFTPLIQPCSEDDSSVDLDTTTSSLAKSRETQMERADTTLSMAGLGTERASTASPAASRPWNIDASYTWDDNEPPKLDVIMPLPERDSSQSGEKVPKFKLRIHRASSSTASKLTKKNRSSEDTMSSVITSSVDLLKSASFRLAQKQRPSIGPGECNSSHDMINTSPMQTRFIERFEQPSLVSPVTGLLPPSPTLDVRSFFSDDSSQAQPRGSLRKRFSEFRTRNSRANSVDHTSGVDRGHLNTTCGLSRASRHSSRQSQTTSVAQSPRSSNRPLRWTFFARLRSWFFRRENGIRLRKRKRNAVPQTDDAEPYAGV